MAQPLDILTEAEYLDLEDESDEKHEFVNGHMIPLHYDPVTGMAGASREHNLVVANVVTALVVALRDSPCEVFPSDMRVRAQRSPFYYPDASVACSPIITLDAKKNQILQNPTLVVEVLSASTERRDRGTKAQSYRQLPSCTDYLLCSSEEVLVEHQFRNEHGEWVIHARGPGEHIQLRGLGITLAVDDLYRKVFG